MNPNSKALADEWFKSGLSDLSYAEIGLNEVEIFPQVAFLSQQVAEKFLKGFLTLNDVEPPRTHELPNLLDMSVKIKPELENLRDACELLAGFYIETRYPPDIPDYTKEEISEVFEKAKFVKEAIESLK
jgi:HEPN domain-containing protein